MFGFSGRARRKEYWDVYLITPDRRRYYQGVINSIDFRSGASISVYALFAGNLPSVLALAIRRLHDTDRSGAWALLFLLVSGWLVLLVFSHGSISSDGYGNDPKFGSN
ncbi:DUF805 domain-containing protein [Shigella flexneri]